MHPKQIETTVPGKLNAVQVVNGDLTFALKKFKKLQKDSEVILECYQRKFYTKPSVAKRKQLATAKYLQQKESEKG